MSRIKRCVRKAGECLECQIKMIKKKKRPGKKKKRKWKSNGVKGGRDRVNSLEGAGWFWTSWNTHSNWHRRGGSTDRVNETRRMRREGDAEGGGVSGPSEGQAPARRFRPHGPSRRWEYWTLWLPKTHRVCLGLWARRTVSHSAALDCVGCVSARPFCRI